MSKKVNSKKLRYLILREIESGGGVSSDEVGLTAEELDAFILGMQSDGLIEGVRATKDRLVFLNLRITLIGEEYMEKNSGWSKFYKSAKEVRDWIPFLY